MSIAVIERVELSEPAWWEFGRASTSCWPRMILVPYTYDPNGRDGEWHATISLPHEIVCHDGMAVPAFEGDLERIAWHRNRPPARTASF